MSKTTRLSPTKSTVVPNIAFTSLGLCHCARLTIAYQARSGPSACRCRNQNCFNVRRAMTCINQISMFHIWEQLKFYVGLLTFVQPHARSATVLVDEFDAGHFQWYGDPSCRQMDFGSAIFRLPVPAASLPYREWHILRAWLPRRSEHHRLRTYDVPQCRVQGRGSRCPMA